MSNLGLIIWGNNRYIYFNNISILYYKKDVIDYEICGCENFY